MRAATHSSSAALEQRTGVEAGEHVEHRGRAVLAGGQGRRLAQHLLAPDLGEVLDGGEHQLGAGAVVVELRAPGDPGPFRDHRGGRA
nr:hypothetical protein GCM10020241_47590 [Streptoalloteichus tenebrarius]